MVKCKWRRASPPIKYKIKKNIDFFNISIRVALALATHLPTWTIFKKCTFGHSGKYVNHRIHAIFLIGLHLIYHIQAKCHKFAIEKSIHKKHLTWQIQQKFYTYSIYIYRLLVRYIHRRSIRCVVNVYLKRD